MQATLATINAYIIFLILHLLFSVISAACQCCFEHYKLQKWSWPYNPHLVLPSSTPWSSLVYIFPVSTPRALYEKELVLLHIQRTKATKVWPWDWKTCTGVGHKIHGSGDRRRHKQAATPAPNSKKTQDIHKVLLCSTESPYHTYSRWSCIAAGRLSGSCVHWLHDYNSLCTYALLISCLTCGTVKWYFYQSLAWLGWSASG